MKALFFTITFILTTSLTLWGQTEKGRWTIGAQLGNFTYQKQESGYRTLSGSVTPVAGYFIANGLVAGAGIPFSFNSTYYGTLYANFYELRQNSTSIGLAPFMRYYLGAAKLKPYLGVSYSYSKTASTQSVATAGGAESKAEGHTTALAPSLGLAYFINRTLGLSLQLNYNVNHLEYATVQTSPYTPGASSANQDSRSLSLAIAFQLFLGQ